MKFTNGRTTLTLTLTECEVLECFKQVVDEANLSADEIKQLLFDIYRGETNTKFNININYADYPFKY